MKPQKTSNPVSTPSRICTKETSETRKSRSYFFLLWYQLTIAIQEFLNLPNSFPFQIPLYNHFITDFQNKINSLKLVEISVVVSQRFTDGNDALEFLSKLADMLKPVEKKDDEPAGASKAAGASGKATQLETNAEAYVLARMSAAHFYLLLGKTKETESAMDECRAIIDKLDSVDTSVRAGFYRVSADYFKWEAAYASYYKTSLLYLACLPNVTVDLDLESRIQRAHDLGLAALLGDTIYNFGELLQHQILESLTGTPFEWIRSLLFAFNEGNLGIFESLTPRFPEEPILQNSYPFLRQKICLMALIDAVFRRSVTDRIMPFEVIASETKLPINEVEHLVMKALRYVTLPFFSQCHTHSVFYFYFSCDDDVALGWYSLGLIKGSLDQISGTASITWVQPRVLNKQQIEALKKKLDDWTNRVMKVGQFAHSNGGSEILVQ
ncbi:26S proteasome regulatory subunit N9 [Puccinia sorghi]|uniref:26S proteasome regulatory subunit N9 n=1 Tax=Puccinia sorghi TaxID=27349 RepID=A0A0L6UFA5_9BASI|nr:26S proteasome regulatory subunit N9 [Puccinia sorghi]